jgi:hypothetical protein
MRPDLEVADVFHRHGLIIAATMPAISGVSSAES